MARSILTASVRDACIAVLLATAATPHVTQAVEAKDATKRPTGERTRAASTQHIGPTHAVPPADYHLAHPLPPYPIVPQPPYLILRQTSGGVAQPTVGQPYSYGWFGAAPRQHTITHEGYHGNHWLWPGRIAP